MEQISSVMVAQVLEVGVINSMYKASRSFFASFVAIVGGKHNCLFLPISTHLNTVRLRHESTEF